MIARFRTLRRNRSTWHTIADIRVSWFDHWPSEGCLGTRALRVDLEVYEPPEKDDSKARVTTVRMNREEAVQLLAQLTEALRKADEGVTT